jgi:hypothetical protein
MLGKEKKAFLWSSSLKVTAVERVLSANLSIIIWSKISLNKKLKSQGEEKQPQIL